MRRSFTKLSNPIGNATKQTLLSSSSAFPYSTSSDGGGGRGRGRGFDFPSSKFSPTSPGNTDSPSPPSTLGHGHGRGQPPRRDSSFSFVAPLDVSADGRGRGGGPISFTQPGPQLPESIQTPEENRHTNQGPNPSFSFGAPLDVSAHAHGGGGPISFTQPGPPPESIQTPDGSISKKPIFLKNEEPVDSVPNPPNQALSSSISILLEGGQVQGRGRGKPIQLATEKPKVENRHIRTRPPPGPGKEKAIGERESNTGPKLSKEEAISRARRVLSRDGDGGGGGGRGSNAVEGGRGGRGRGGRGWRGRGRGRGRGAMDDEDEDEDEEDDDDDEDAEAALEEEEAVREAFVKDFGEEKANLLLETYEEAMENVAPLEDDILEAMDVNYRIECEPEYMVEIENPDIDEKPPIPLRDALEKMKPFLMAYEDIRTDEEWEEVVKDSMANVPLMEKIVDHYAGPDRVTAKQQEEELERVAKTLPESAPSSVQRFTDRAVLSLQSNPGWGVDKKFQFMDKLVQEVSQSYK